jgi:hypothetical protein
MLYIAKDVHEKLDYAFVYSVADPIISVTFIQPPLASLVVESCYVNTVGIEDDQGITYPANQAIILWVSGGTLDTSEKLRLQFTTTAGRILDEDITFRFVEAA